MFQSVLSLSKSYPINSILHTLSLNRSSFYYWLSHHSNVEAYRISLFQHVLSIYHQSNGIYGAPKISASLHNQGFSVSVSTVSRIMYTLGIKSIVPKKFPKKKSRISDAEKRNIINLIKDLDINHINQVWTTDITYIHTIYDGTFYLITFLDYFSKKVVAWGLFDHQTSDQILLVLQKAIDMRNPSPGLIIHSDKGSQFRSKKYRIFLHDHNFIFSHTSFDHSCDENASQESFHSLLKKEAIYQVKLYTFEDAYRVCFDYIEGFYNPIRIHSSIGYLSPDQFEKKLEVVKNPL